MFSNKFYPNSEHFTPSRMVWMVTFCKSDYYDPVVSLPNIFGEEMHMHVEGAFVLYKSTLKTWSIHSKLHCHMSKTETKQWNAKFNLGSSVQRTKDI